MHITKATDIWSIHSVFTLTKIKPKLQKKVVTEQLYEKEKNSVLSYVDDISDIEVEVVEIESNMAVDITLGGYCE